MNFVQSGLLDVWRIHCYQSCYVRVLNSPAPVLDLDVLFVDG